MRELRGKVLGANGYQTGTNVRVILTTGTCTYEGQVQFRWRLNGNQLSRDSRSRVYGTNRFHPWVPDFTLEVESVASQSYRTNGCGGMEHEADWEEAESPYDNGGFEASDL